MVLLFVSFFVGCCSYTLNCFLCLPCSIVVGGFVIVENCRDAFNFIFLVMFSLSAHMCFTCVC